MMKGISHMRATGGYVVAGTMKGPEVVNGVVVGKVKRRRKKPVVKKRTKRR